MENMTTTMTSLQLRPQSGIRFGMPAQRELTSGCFQGTSVAAADFGATTSARIRKVAAKGHVALAAYVPGHPAWSPPIC